MSKKIILWIVGILAVLGVSNAQTLTLSTEGDGTFGYGCLVPVDVYVDTNGEEIMGTDLVISSSMEYVDFVPNTGLFSYFLSPIVDESMIRIGGFSMDNLYVTTGKIGTLYFLAKTHDNDELWVKFYFLGPSKPGDSNLVNFSGEDLLKSVNNAYMELSHNIDTCNNDGLVIPGGYGEKSEGEVLDEIINDIEKVYGKYHFNWLENKTICISLLLVVIFLIVVLLKKILDRKGKSL